jgi:hypothetical protein
MCRIVWFDGVFKKITKNITIDFLTSLKWFDENVALTFQALVVALGEEEHGLSRPLRSLQKTLTVGILTQAGEQEAIGTGHFRQQGLSRRRAVVQLHVVVECALFVACNIKKIFAILKIAPCKEITFCEIRNHSYFV